MAAGSAVELVGVQQRADSIAADRTAYAVILARAIDTSGVLIGSGSATIIEAGSAVPRIAREISAGVAAAASAEKPGIRAAVPAGGDALGLLRFVTTPAEGFAGIALRCSHGVL